MKVHKYRAENGTGNYAWSYRVCGNVKDIQDDAWFWKDVSCSKCLTRKPAAGGKR